jgi:hypothetical protein
MTGLLLKKNGFDEAEASTNARFQVGYNPHTTARRMRDRTAKTYNYKRERHTTLS